MFFEIIKAVLIGLLEGITEWLPISSTGHMILFNELLTLKVSDEFFELFEVVIQLGAVLAVALLYFSRLNPLSRGKSREEKRATLSLLLKTVAAVLPSAVAGLLFDDVINERFYNYLTVSLALIIYGAAFILLERRRGGRSPSVCDTEKISYRHAFLIGVFQVLSLIPGTSRSGATILGASLLGLSRTAAAEFSFFMAIPTMLGASLLKTAKFVGTGIIMTPTEALLLAVGSATAFLVSLISIKFLTDFVKRHSFSPFGIYRIILGGAVLVYFLIFGR